MANTYLTSTDSNYKISNNNTNIFGTSATDENVLIDTSVIGTTVNSTVEKVDLAGAIADFRFKQGFGSNIEVQDDSDNVIMTLTDVAAKKLSFTDGTVDLTFDSATSVVSVGGTPITTTAAAVVPITIDTTDLSSVGSATSTAGQTFTLTSGNDAILGTTGSDTIDGSLTGTLNTGDAITDTSVSDADVLNATISGSSKPTVSNVETLNLDMRFGSIFDAGSTSNVNALNVQASQSGVNSATLANTSNLYEIDPDGLTSLKLGSSSKVKLEGETIAISNDADGGSAGDDITLNSTGSANTVTLGTNYSHANTEVTLTGDQDITLKSLATAQTVTDNQSSGVSKFSMGDEGTFDASKVAVDQIEVGALSGTLTVADGANVTLTDGHANADIDTSASNATLNLTSTDATALAVDVGTFKTVNYTLGAADQIITIKALASSATETLNILGSQDAEITLITTAAAAPLSSLDASGATGNLVLKNVEDLQDTSATESSSVQGGSGNDTFQINAIAATNGGIGFLGNAGNDVFKLKGDVFSGSTTGQQIAFLGGEGTDSVLVQDATLTIASAGVNNNQILFDVEQITLKGQTTAGIDANATLTFGNDDILNGLSLNFVGENNAASNTVEVSVNAGTAVNIDMSDNIITHSGLDAFKLVGVATTTSIKGSNAAETINAATTAETAVTLEGNDGDDIINGGGNAVTDVDTIKGGAGNDTIMGNVGSDILYGNAGNDIFKYGTADASDTLTAAQTAGFTDEIKDFVVGSDKIDLSSILGVAAGGYTSVVVDNATAVTNVLEVEELSAAAETIGTPTAVALSASEAVGSTLGDNELLYWTSYNSTTEKTTLTIAADANAVAGTAGNVDIEVLQISFDGNIDISDSDFVFI